MKICYVATTVHISKNLDECMGGTTHTFSIAREFAKQGHEVHLISKKLVQDKDFEVIEGVNVFRFYRGIFTSGETIKKTRKIGLSLIFRFFSNIALALKVAKIVREKNCNIIFERAHSLQVGTIASILTKKPLFVEVIDNFFSKAAIKRAKKIFAYTNAFFEKKVFPKITLVNAGFDSAIFKPLKEKQKYDLCYAGSFKFWDGLEDLVFAVKKLKRKKSFSDIKVLLLGQGDKLNHIKKLIKKNNLEKNFVLSGKVPLAKVPKFIAQSKICIAPYNVKSHKRSDFGKFGFNFSPLKVVEYMACAKPVIATDYNTITKLFPKNSGVFFEQDNNDDLSKKIEMLLNKKDLKKFGEKNLFAVRNLNWKSVCKKILGEIKKEIN